MVGTPVHDVVALHGHIVRLADDAPAFAEACRAAMCECGPLRRQRRIDALIAVTRAPGIARPTACRLLVEFAREPAGLAADVPLNKRLVDAVVAPQARQMLFPGLLVPDPPLNIQEESVMNRSIPLSLVFVVALASQVALGGCSKKEDVGSTPPDASASAPDTSASSAMSAASATPMDSASAAAATDAASH